MWWMALELVEGVDLAALRLTERAPGDRLPVDVAVKIAADVAYGLAHAHESGLGDDGSGVVHRDVSPSNILLSCFGDVKLADFGIAKVQKRDEKTRSGQIMGKVRYLSPEQALGMDVDGRSDLFSLGIVMFEMLAGVGPYKAVIEQQAAVNAINGKRTRWLSVEAPDVSPELASIVDALVETKPENRIQTAAELGARLDQLGAWQLATRRLASIVRGARPRVDVGAEG